MKILHINAVCGIRSTGRICVEIADYLDDKGVKSYIAYSEGLPYKNSHRIGTVLEKKLHAFLSRVFGKQAYFSRRGTKSLLKYMDNIKPDVVHLHNLHSNYINLKILTRFLAKKDIPTVITLHDCWFYTGKCSHYTVDGCYKWKSICHNCPRLKKDNPSWFIDCTTKLQQDKKDWLTNIPRLAVVGVSDWITNEARESILKSANIISKVYNWIDVEVFKPIDTKLLRCEMHLNDKFMILGVASEWSNAKGLDKFIEIANILKDNAVVVLVGNISVKDTVLPQNMVNIPETHDVNKLVQYYSMANVLLNLSMEESFGKVSAESLACGTPVITINSTANSEIVGNDCGYVIKTSKTNDILKAIELVRDNGKEYYTDNCIQYAKSNFLLDERVNDYLNIYKQILGLN